jgi:hypothetical protein
MKRDDNGTDLKNNNISVLSYRSVLHITCMGCEKSLKIPKGQSEFVYRRRTDNTMAKDRVTRTPLKTGGELRCSGRVSSSCSTSGTRRVNLFTNPVVSRE